MANTLTSPTRHIDRLIRYVLTDKPGQAKGERWVAAAAGNGFVVDAAASVKIATDVMRRHRKLEGFVQGYHVIDSYAVDELDPSKPEDFERAQKAGRRRAQRLAKGRPYLVVTQIDGKGSEEHPGGKLHNHIVILSTHPVTGRAFDSSWVTHKRLAAEHDEILAEVGITQTLPPALAHRANVLSKAEFELPGRIAMWESQRAMALEAGEAFTEPMPVVWIADMKVGIAGVMAHTGYTSREEAIEVARAEFSLDLRLRGREEGLPGISWSVLDEQGNTTKMTRRSSTLGTDFGCAALDAAIERNIALQREQQAAEQAKSALPPLLFNETRTGDHVVRTPSTFQMLQAGYSHEVIEQLKAAWGAEQNGGTPDSGAEVLDQAEQLETGENGVSEEQIEPSEAAEEPESGSDAQNGPRAGEIGREMGAADLIENSEILVDEQTGSRSDSATSRTPDVGPILATSGRDMATIGRTLGTASDHEAELELLELRYRIVTEGASWTDDEYIQALLRMDALRDQLGIGEDAAPPSPEAVIAEYEQRVLRPTQPDQHEPELASAHAAASPSSDAHALDDAGALDDSPADAHAVAGSGRASAHAAPTPYKSKLWTLAQETEDAEERARIEGYARFDEGAREVLAGGGRIPNSDVPEKLRLRFLRVHGDKFDPLVKEELLLRDAALTARSKEYQTGKRHWDALQALGDREQLDRIGRQIHDGYTALLEESNARRELMGQRLSLGIYEEDATWEPGQPIPSRQEARDRAKRRAEQRRERTMAAVEGASTDHALDTDRDRDKSVG